MDFQALLLELKDKYAQVRKLLDSDDKIVDETKPYKNKYAAIEILKEMQSSLLKTSSNVIKEENDVNTLLAIISLNLGIVYVETEELKLGEEFFMNCIDNLSENETLPQRIIPMISALNQLGILWSQRNQASVSKTFLERAKDIYKKFMMREKEPINMSKLFLVEIVNEEEAKTVLEKLHTLTLYYLAQIYGTLEDYLKSAIYCHMTLSRQLEYKDFESIDWALNAATLSQFFLEKECFSQARHYLSAASYVLRNYQNTLTAIETDVENDEESAAKLENYKHRSADISRCWVKYGILLLTASKERLLLKSENEQQEEKKPEIDKDCLEKLQFTSIEKNIESIANEITDNYLLDFSDAKLVFFKINEWIDSAKQYYSLENHASDYVQLIQDQSQAYKDLAFFHNDEAQQAKMHKRRIDMLEDVLKELHETYYQSSCRQIWMELGETYSEILDIKLDRLQASDDRPTPNMLKKINNLTGSSIKNFEKFIESLKSSKIFVDTNKFPDEMVRAVLSAYFHVGRLYNKFITPDKQQQLENVEKSYNAYSFLVNYCERNSNAKELMHVELSVCKDFVKLLPLKISKLKLEMRNP
ncbi:KIF-binding protein-like [Leptopilina heterotoma]|uniref:KIF-binding protein-like n=1 Tax=Leptopilina heterotoma TaxID=63436 RepID=UPI001CA9DA9F|nr:KIF-binding protein-like [Leptopilina heterotoma]